MNAINTYIGEDGGEFVSDIENEVNAMFDDEDDGFISSVECDVCDENNKHENKTVMKEFAAFSIANSNRKQQNPTGTQAKRAPSAEGDIHTGDVEHAIQAHESDSDSDHHRGGSGALHEKRESTQIKYALPQNTNDNGENGNNGNNGNSGDLEPPLATGGSKWKKKGAFSPKRKRNQNYGIMQSGSVAAAVVRADDDEGESNRDGTNIHEDGEVYGGVAIPQRPRNGIEGSGVTSPSSGRSFSKPSSPPTSLPV